MAAAEVLLAARATTSSGGLLYCHVPFSMQRLGAEVITESDTLESRVEAGRGGVDVTEDACACRRASRVTGLCQH